MRADRPIDFLVIGAEKAGTTTLHRWLAAEGASLPKQKESRFFVEDERYALGPDWYRRQFAPGSLALRGEVDPLCISSIQAPPRVREIAGDIPIVAILRNPLARAYSHFGMCVTRGWESRTFAEVLAEEIAESKSDSSDRDLGAAMQAAREATHRSRDTVDGRTTQRGVYIWPGLYSRHLDRWRSQFTRVHVHFFEDLFTDRRRGHQEYLTLLREIGGVGEGVGWDPDRREVPSVEPRSKRLAAMLYNPGAWSASTRALASIVPRRARSAIWRALALGNRSTVPLPAMPRASALPVAARELFAADIAQLQEQTGRNLAAWTEGLALR